jgi:ATP-dependent Clp protease protease subunit
MENEISPEEDDKQIIIINNIESPQQDGSVRSLSLYGDINESKCGDLVSVLLYLKDTSEEMTYEDPEDPDSEIITTNRPINLLISTNGGCASEMFSVYDTMRLVQKTCDIETVGMGQVMSAGVLLLAAGSPGKRKIGANCRVMIHSVAGGLGGSLSNMENEIAEVRWIQDRYIKCLAEKTKMTERHIKRLFKKQIDVYLSAEEAVEFGIADEII